MILLLLLFLLLIFLWVSGAAFIVAFTSGFILSIKEAIEKKDKE